MRLAKRPGPGRYGGFPRSSGAVASFLNGSRLWRFAAGCNRRRWPGGNGGLFPARAGAGTGRARGGDARLCATIETGEIERGLWETDLAQLSDGQVFSTEARA